VSRHSSQLQTTSLHRHEGSAFISASEALIKGTLESELEVSLISGSRGRSWAPVLELATTPAVSQLLRQHGIRCVSSPEAVRALTLGLQAARSGRSAVVLIPNDELDLSMTELGEACRVALDRGGAMAIVLEDDPRRCPMTCPRRAAARANLPAIEVGDVGQLRDSIEQSLRLSRAGRSPVGVVVHSSILRSLDTLDLRPNRVMGAADVLTAKRRRPRTPRWSEAGGALRLARRMELNQFRAMPSPGERVPVGFVAVGPANGAIGHLANVLGLYSRVPVLQLGLINPVDEPAIERLLTRCEQVIVLEPRPGVVESFVVTVAEVIRRRGEALATVWGRTLPSTPEGRPVLMDSDEDLHPSVLVRKISHLLRQIRPTLEVSAQLVPEPSVPSVPLASRQSLLGPGAAMSLLRRIVTEVDQWLRGAAPLEERNIAASSLAIDGQEPPAATPRVVSVELWEHRRFLRDGLAALVQAAQDDRPWIMIICEEFGQDIGDLERLARGAVPADRAERVTLELANLADRVALREVVRDASLNDRMTIVIVRDGPPPQYDVAALERVYLEIDQLGFEPRQKVVRSAEAVCEFRPNIALTANEARDASSMSMQSAMSIENAPAGRGAFIRFRPLLEEVEVVRTRPPVAAWHGSGGAKLSVPQVIHAKHSVWRAHCAGVRGEGPGVAPMVLCHAGRTMGYRVRCVHQPEAIGPGRRAWAQVSFSNPREGEHSLPLSALIPFGETDLLIGLDVRETFRAIGSDPTLRVAFGDRTFAVVNVGAIGEDGKEEPPTLSPDQISDAIAGVTQSGLRLMEDVAAACRTWFHTDRLTDMALLGAAYQLGLIPVTAEAIEAAVRAVESRGFSRSMEAFDFGRHVAVDRGLLKRPEHDHEEEVEHVRRRIVLSLSRGGWGGGSRARQFATLLNHSLDRMPGLTETDAGRQARREFIMALHRCLIWGGLEYAGQFAELITRLYRADRGDRGRLLCRNAVLPLAEAMLLRDPIYIASMATSAEQRRRTRQQLNVKEARGDHIERRYLTRIDALVYGRRLRADVRTSDWPARLLAATRRLIPQKWRGSARERELRQYVMDVVRRATAGAESDYDLWAEAMIRLHEQAAENRLRDMVLAEVRMLVEPQVGLAPAMAPAVGS
jgi:hypothetical protein